MNQQEQEIRETNAKLNGMIYSLDINQYKGKIIKLSTPTKISMLKSIIANMFPKNNTKRKGIFTAFDAGKSDPAFRLISICCVESNTTDLLFKKLEEAFSGYFKDKRRDDS